MTANPVTVPASATVARFLHDLLPWLRRSDFPVVGDGQTVGLVTVPGQPGSCGLASASACPRRRIRCTRVLR